MKCTVCKIKESKTPNGRWCNSCYVSKWYREHPDKMPVKDPYGGNRKRALIRDHYTCQSCGKNKDRVARLDIHHIDGNGSGKSKAERNNNLDNLITLCSTCHYEVETARRGRTNAEIIKWSRKVDKCLGCETTKKKHVSHGLCGKCLFRKLRKENGGHYIRRYDKRGRPPQELVG